jgi:hypothetical protein
MKIIVTIKDKNLNLATDRALAIGEVIYNKYKLKICRCRCRADGTSIILEK